LVKEIILFTLKIIQLFLIFTITIYFIQCNLFSLIESIDVFEERLSTKSQELYQGLLYALEDMTAYGYVTNSKIKIVLVLGINDSVKDSEIRLLMKKVANCYCTLVFNPFYDEDDRCIKSSAFDREMQNLILN
jgi:hypothetical protein